MRFSFLALLIAVALQLSVVPEAACSNIEIANSQVGSLSAGSTTVTFDVTWANSWRTTQPGAPAPNNWDAAWVFVKYRKNGGNWAHASLNNTGHSSGSGTAATISVGYPHTNSAFNIATNPGVGVFIYRSADGTGTFSLTGVSLSWNYSQDGVTSGDTVDIRVYAIEMVNIPDGAFFAGDNSTSSSSFRQGSSDNDPWYIGSEGSMSVSNSAGSGTGIAETSAEYYYVSSSNSGESATGEVFSIPGPFPKGYQSFYMMKGEISQGQWVAFFNTLSSSQQPYKDATSSSGKNSDALTYRNNVSWSGSGDATLPDAGSGATYRAVAMNYLSWADVASYLDWSGLRPMSELEFERAARGPYRAVAGEYAWGATSITQATAISSQGAANEAPSSAANCVYGGHASVQGPMRVGAMAYGDSTRIASGAGYYGIMDLSGNLQERVVTVGNSTGRSFDGRYHGNGSLDSLGHSDVNTWPATSATGSGFRGGAWSSSSIILPVSERGNAAAAQSNRHNSYGGRGVRLAPAAAGGSPTPTPTATPTSTPTAAPTSTATPTATPGGVNSSLTATTDDGGTGLWGFSCNVTGTDTVTLMYYMAGVGESCPGVGANVWGNFGNQTNGSIGSTCSAGTTICCYTVTAGYTGNTPSDGGVIQSASIACGAP
jgi:formylglycine-generating enzyme required for sulfatase activity